MLRRVNKKRTGTVSLINFHDFVKIRHEKEKIINNPFEENWKKAIVMEELLELYKPQQGGCSPSPTTYHRSDFENAFGFRKRNEDEEMQWDNNEDNQLNRYYKMVDGLNRWQDNFQQQHIEKVAKKIEKRGKQHQCGQIVSNSEKKKKKIKVKYNKMIFQHFQKDQLKVFSKMMSSKQSRFTEEKKEVDRLQRLAATHYGVSFTKSRPKEDIDVSLEEFKRRDKEIFQNFISTVKHSRPQSQNCALRTFVESDSKQQDSCEINTSFLRRSPTKELNLLCGGKVATCKKRYLRV